MTVRLAQDGLLIDGKEIPLMSGAVHYWRLAPARWAELLDRVAEMGFTCIELYIPWSAHERDDLSYDFSGALDLGTFLDLAAERDLLAIVRPGPHINAEITGFGYPDRILNDQELLARGPRGNPVFVPAPPRMFPAVSYAGQRLYREFDRFLEALAPILKTRLHPQGPIVAIQADNEMTMFFRTGAFDLDYSDAAVDDYREYLRGKYKSVGELNRAHRTGHKQFLELRPPARFEAEKATELPRYLDWAEFREHYFRRGVTRVAELFEKRGLGGIPVTHNYPLGELGSPLDLPGLEQEIDLVGMDMYYQRRDYRSVKERCAALCGQSRLPYTPEFASGCYHAWPPIDLHDQVFTTLAAWMHGLRGFNFYMIVDRERWYGAPVRRDGSIDPERIEFYKRFLAFTRKYRGARRHADVILLTSRLLGRLINLTNAFDPLSPMALSGLGLDPAAFAGFQRLGLKHPPAATHAGLLKNLFGALSESRLSFDQGEPDNLSGRLSGYSMAILPTAEILEGRATSALLEYAQAGGTLVIGPEVPRIGERGRPDPTFRRALPGNGQKLGKLPYTRTWTVGRGRVVVLQKLHELARDPAGLCDHLSELAGLAGCRKLPNPGDNDIDVALHLGEPDLLWLANPTREERSATLMIENSLRLKDVWSEESFSGHRDYKIPMPPYSVRPLEVIR